MLLEGEPQSRFRRSKFDFVYVTGQNKGGYTLEAYNHGQKEMPVTQLSRLIELRKEGIREVLLFDFHNISNPTERGYKKKVEAIRDIFGNGGYTLSRVEVYPKDIFRKHLAPLRNRYVIDSSEKSCLENYFEINQHNLCLLLSDNTSKIRELGKLVLSKLENQS